MNKLQILKKVFEKVGYQVEIFKYDDGGYYLELKEKTDEDGNNIGFAFNEDFEPTIYDFQSEKHILLKDFYKKSIDNKPIE